jgi:CHASE1-domain containing sensor protein
MNRPWVNVVAILLILLLTVTIVITAKENLQLEKENERLMLKNDSLPNNEIHSSGDLLNKHEKLDSLRHE